MFSVMGAPRPAPPAQRFRRVALIAGVPGLALASTVALVAIALLLIPIGNGAVLGARDAASRSAANAAGVTDTDLAAYQRAGIAANVPWQLLAALAQAQQAAGPDAGHRGPFRIATGTAGISDRVADLADRLASSPGD